jgi:hypothetical protein
LLGELCLQHNPKAESPSTSIISTLTLLSDVEESPAGTVYEEPKAQITDPVLYKEGVNAHKKLVPPKHSSKNSIDPKTGEPKTCLNFLRNSMLRPECTNEIRFPGEETGIQLVQVRQGTHYNRVYLQA